MRIRPERHESEATDGGFTLVELSVAMTVLFAVLLPFMFTLLNLMAKETASIVPATTTGSVRVVMQALQNDLQAANPLTSTPASGSTSATATIKLGPSSGTQKTITWTVASGKLTRQVGAATAITQLTGVTSATPFTYYSPNGPFQTGELATCASRINITLVVSTGANNTPFTAQQDVELINVEPGSITSCH